MIIEDYYGFNGKSSATNELMRQKSSNRTQKSQRTNNFKQKSPLRTLKRTELSKEKLNSRDRNNVKRMASPQLLRQQISKQQSSNVRMTINESEGMDSNRQQIEMMVKKYDNYKNTDSYEFRQAELQAYNRSSHIPQTQNNNHNNQRSIRYERETPLRRNRLQSDEQQAYYDKNYRSSSRGRNQSFLVHFQREGPTTNAIERYTQNHSSSNDIRAKKSRSLGAKFRPYKMHTFYNAERRQYFNYNEEGYMTDRQYELLYKIQQKALRAFQKATAQVQVSIRRTNEGAPKVNNNPRQIQIIENSIMKHKNSNLLRHLDSDNELAETPLSSRKQLSKDHNNIKRDKKVIELSINPKSVEKESHYDDYQMGITSKRKEQFDDSINSSIDKKQVQKDIFKKFAIEQSADDSSLLDFKPHKPKQQQLNIPLQKQDSVKRSSQISNDYKSIDMMEINSNYKPTNKQLKQRNQFIIDDNRSLGMDTLKNHQMNIPKVEDVRSERDSNLQISSSEQSSSQSSSTNKKSSKKSNHQSKGDSDHKLDFQKNKMKKSYSMSEPVSESSMHDNLRKIDNSPNKDIVGNFKKANNPLTESERLVSSKDSISLQANNTSNNSKKIKRLTRVSKQPVALPEQHHFEDNLEALGVQSFQNYDHITQTIKLKVSPAGKNSKISERSPKSEIEQASVSLKEKDNSRFKEKPSNSSFRQKSQASIAYRSKVRGSIYNSSNVQYDLFTQIHQFIELQQYQYHQPRHAKEALSQIPQELDAILGNIQDHLYILNIIAQIILLVPEVYDFQTIYEKGKDWIIPSMFLTLKKYIFQRNRVVIALKGGKNCFKLLNYIIEDHILKKYLNSAEVKSILQNLEECNLKLDKIMNNFANFLSNFNKQLYGKSPQINTKPFRMNEDLVILITEYIHEVETLKVKKEQQFKGGDISPDDEEEYQMMALLNERMFRLMEMTFIMSNLAGRQIKQFEKEEELFREQDRFKDYMFKNEELFKQTVKYFK